MMTVLLDTDVVLALVLARDPFVVEAAAIWLANEQGRCTVFISPITPVNVFYITRRSRSADAARQAVRDVLSGLSIAPLLQHDLHVAEALPMTDFEDALHGIERDQQVEVAAGKCLAAPSNRSRGCCVRD